MSDKNDTRAMLLGASPWKLVLSLSVPAIIGMVVVGLYNLMDAVFVGQMGRKQCYDGGVCGLSVYTGEYGCCHTNRR